MARGLFRGDRAFSRCARVVCGGVLGVLLQGAFAEPVRAGDPTELSFVRDGRIVNRWDRAEFLQQCRPQRVSVSDPYHEMEKSYLACPIRDVLERGFELDTATLQDQQFLLEARDGFVRPAPGHQLLEAGGYLAFGEAEVGHWQPIDRRQVDPGPYYMVWEGSEKSDPHRYPWPFQLVEIRMADVQRQFPHTVPGGLPPDAEGWRGYALFRTQCIACHAINGQGGKVGPDLNVPRSIVEYRPAEQIKAYVRDPVAFRYTTMPAHPGLGDQDLDDLVAYFHAMRERKRDPGRETKPSGSEP